MPYSSGVFDTEVEDLIRRTQPLTVLDVGAGAGRYGQLVKRINPSIKTVAIEIDSEYIDRFKLREIYDVVINENIENIFNDVDRDYDFIIIGDVIEHLRKSVGIDLLNFLVYRSRRIITIFPLRYRQGAFGGRNHEAHLSIWGQSDFQWCDANYLERSGIAFVDIAGFID